MKNIKSVTVQAATERIAPHREAFRRVPVIDGGLGLCPNLNGK